MKFRYTLIAALCSGLTLPMAMAETAPSATPAEATSAEQVIMSINGVDITPSVFNAYRLLRQRPEPSDPQQAQIVILNELVNVMLVSQDADARELGKAAGSEILFDMSRRLALMELGIQDVIRNYQVSDEEIKKAYDSAFADLPKEYKARHILVKEETSAREIIAELEKGADFAELAKSKSEDPGSGAEGGDLGWFTTDRMVEPFAAAVMAQEKGVISKEPVQSPFGYHIILVEDVRDASPPALEEVRNQLEMELKQQKLSTYVTELRDKADIKVNAQEEAVTEDQPPSAKE